MQIRKYRASRRGWRGVVVAALAAGVLAARVWAEEGDAAAAAPAATNAAEEAEATVSAVDRWITEFTGSPLYPSQLGKPGWPGMVPGQAATHPWGYPERIPYPGAVEHVRVETQRYIPVVPLYNAKTLVKNFLAAELPGIAVNRIVEYAEPIYSVPKYEGERPTGQCNKPVKVVRWDKSPPAIELDLGRLEPAVYVVRAIAATPTENVQRASQRLVIQFEVNDGVKGETGAYRKRCAAIDEFYSIVEFFFVAPEARVYTARLKVDPSTVLPVLYLHNIDLHNKLAQLARRAGKTGPSFYEAAARAEEWKRKGSAKADERSPEKRLADDAALWNSAMPINAQPAGVFGGGNDQWTALFRSATFMIPAGVTDDGMGVDFYGKDMIWNRTTEYLAPIASKNDWTVKSAATMGGYNLTRQTAYAVAHAIETTSYRVAWRAIPLAKQFHETGDETAARDAAICLARLGLQNLTHGSRQSMAQYDVIPQFQHGDTAFRRRYKEMDYMLRGNYGEKDSLIESYDYLFPFIRDNVELAQSLGRFLPWIKTPADAVAFYETFVLQYYAHQLMTYNVYLDQSLPAWMPTAMAVQQDPAITKPWCDWLYSHVWTYPNRPMGLDAVAVNAVNRDGCNNEGSTYYTMGGSFLSDIAASLRACVKAGQKLPVDVSDPDRFPKTESGARFKWDIMVAGGYTFNVGDVSGPNRPRLHDVKEMNLRRTPEKIPNNPSRVLSCFAGILESGRDQADFRLRRAAGIRVGSGFGHAHNDPLDLQIWAHGVPMCGDGGARPGYASPGTDALLSHNTVVSGSAAGHRWISSFAPMAGAQYLMGRVLNFNTYARQVMLIDAGRSDSYVVDIFRVANAEAPSYAFHGMPADLFEVNAADRKPGTFGGFLAADTRWSGTAADTLVATWRMRREPETVTWTGKDGKAESVKVPGAERMAMGEDFEPAAPRKFIRMHLVGQAGAQAYGARTICSKGETFTYENLYAKPKSWKGGTVFAAVYEPYAGEPFIRSVRLLTPAATLGDAQAAVALEIVLADGRKDVVYAAPRDSGATTVPEAGTFQGEFAFVSRDAKGVRQASLAGGTRLQAAGIDVAAEQPAYTGVVQSVDYGTRTAVLSGAMPKEAAGAEIEIGPERRPTSYTLTGAEGNGARFLKGMDFALAFVTEVSAEGLPVVENDIPVVPGMTVTDADARNFWRFGADAKRDRLALEGAPAPREALKPGATLRVWEFGPGDAYRLPVQVNVTRSADGKFTTAANAPARVRMGR